MQVPANYSTSNNKTFFLFLDERVLLQRNFRPRDCVAAQPPFRWVREKACFFTQKKCVKSTAKRQTERTAIWNQRKQKMYLPERGSGYFSFFLQ
jgi:hypothetical protein